MFPIRLHYNPDVGCFEEFKHKLADDVMDDNAKRAASLSRFSHFKSTIDVRGFKIGYYVKVGFLSQLFLFTFCATTVKAMTYVALNVVSFHAS